METVTERESMSVGETARAVGVSIRTLHHWEEIGLLTPSDRTWAGYRLYDRQDIARIQRILVYRELGFTLPRIAEILDAGESSEHLARQRELLTDRISRLQEMVSAVDRMLEGAPMNIDKQARLFGQDWNPGFHTEAEERWGRTPEWRESQSRLNRMNDDDVARIKADTVAVEEALAEAMRAGVKPGSEEANALAERHRELLSSFYEVTASKSVVLADMYVSDPRFAQRYDAREPGFAAWLRSVIRENARRHGVDPDQAAWV